MGLNFNNMDIRKMYIILFVLASTLIGQDEPEAFFKKNCASCHTIGGGKLTGPDLKDMHLRKDDQWIKDFINDPMAVINSGDSYALKILEESRGVVMPKVGGLTPFITQSLLDLIKKESQKDKSIFGSAGVKDRPLTKKDIEIGKQLFMGEKSFKNNGVACIACHQVNGMGSLGGGRLGPDLTKVYSRLGGKKALSAWLGSPSSETMAPIYNNHPIDESEVLPLVAFFKDSNKSEVSGESGKQDFIFMIIGILGLIFSLIIFDLIWGNRLQSIRKQFVKGAM